MEENIRQWINQQPWLSDETYDSVKNIIEFKEDMNYVYIRACKDPDQMRSTLPFIAINEAVFAVFDT